MNKHRCINLLLIAILQLMFRSCYTLKTIYVNQMCPAFNPTTVIYDLSRASAGDTSVVFKTSPSGGYPGNIDCTIVIKSSSGGFVVSCNKLNIRDTDRIRLKDSANIPYPLLNNVLTKVLPNFWFTFSSVSDTLTLHFTTGRTQAESNYYVELFFTSYSNFRNGTHDFRCKNGKYIWSGFKCDSHYHCGDGSEQENCGPEDGHFISSRWFTVLKTTTTRVPGREIKDEKYHRKGLDYTTRMIVGCVAAVCVLGGAAILYIYKKNEKKNITTTRVAPPQQPYAPSAPLSDMQYHATYSQFSYPLNGEMYPPPPPYTPKAKE